MKKAALLTLSAMLCFGGAAYADMAKLQESYVSGAFADADDDWRRLTANRYGDCGEYGSQGLRRVDVLIERYEALGSAMESGNAQAVSAAAKSFSSLVEGSTRFEGCWDAIARKQGIKSRFKREAAKV